MLKEFKRIYNLMEDIGYEEDMINTICDYPDDYTIEEAITEIADSNVYLYDADLWSIAPKLRFYIEDAIHDYGYCEGNLIKLFQMGQYEYNCQVMYNNIDQIIFNIALNHLEMLLEYNNINIEAFIKEIEMDLLLDYINNEIKLSINNNSRIEQINILVNDQFFDFIEEQDIDITKFELEVK